MHIPHDLQDEVPGEVLFIERLRKSNYDCRDAERPFVLASGGDWQSRTAFGLTPERWPDDVQPSLESCCLSAFQLPALMMGYPRG
jgi:hypothetical protein